jgi:hypothetical protein
MSADLNYLENRARRQQLEHEAVNERLAQQARRAARPTTRMYHPLLAQLGRQMVNLGEQLQARSETPTGTRKPLGT